MSLPMIEPYRLPTLDEVPRSRVGWRPDPSRGALLIHDMQRYFVEPFVDASSLIANIVSLRAACRQLGVPVVYTAQPANQSTQQRGLLNDVWGPGLGHDETGARIIDELAPASDERVLIKWRYSAFVRTELERHLIELGRSELYICGIYAHIGCLMTACDAFSRDIRPFLLADGTADFDGTTHRQAIAYVARRCGAVTTIDALVEQLVEGHRYDDQDALIIASLVRSGIADAVGIAFERIDLDARPDDLGLDSVRLMGLVEAWTHGVPDVDFVRFAACRTVGELVAVVVDLRQGSGAREATA